LATGYACSSPMLCIAGQIASNGIGQRFGMLHEVNDQSRTLASVTKWSALARSPDELPALVRDALRICQTQRRRPVAMEVPPDVLQAKKEFSLLAPDAVPAPPAPPADAIARAAALLGKARF